MKLKIPKLNKRTWISVGAVVILALGFFFFFRSQSPSAEATWPPARKASGSESLRLGKPPARKASGLESGMK